MQEFLIAVGLFLVFEGLLYALFPAGVKNMARRLPEVPDSVLRNFGVVAMIVGVAVIWMIKR